MMEQQTLTLLALLGIVLSGLAFFYYATKDTTQNASGSLTPDGYLLSNRTVTPSSFAKTFFASSAALGNFIFFIQFHKLYGFLVAFCPTFYFFTKFFILKKLMHNASIQKKHYRTLAELWYAVFPCQWTARCIALLSCITALMALFTELYIGSIILAVLLPDTDFFRAGAFLFMGTVILAYVYSGGYKAIVKTDGWQLYLMILAAIAIAIFVLYAPVLHTQNMINHTLSLGQLFSFEEKGFALWLFLSWGITNNICFCYTDPPTWQRISALGSLENAFGALKAKFWMIFVVLWIPALAFVLLFLKGYEYSTLPEFLRLITDSSGPLKYVLYPIIVTGFASALFSSADTSLIAALYSLCDSNTLLPVFNRLSQENRHQALKNYLFVGCFMIVLLMSFLYYLQGSILEKWLMPILYAVWNQTTILAPFALYALMRLSKNQPPLAISKKHSLVLAVFLMVAFGLIIHSAYYAGITGDFRYSQAVSLIGVFIVAGSIYAVLNLTKQEVKVSKLKVASI